MCGLTGIVLALGPLALPVDAQQLGAARLVPTSPVVELPPLPSSYFSGRLAAVPETICEIVRRALPGASDDATAPNAMECAISKGPFFVMARSHDDRLTNWRMKLSSSPENTEADLAQLAQLTQNVHNELGWWMPDLVADSIGMGVDILCSSGTVQYRFARERNGTSSFNLVILMKIAGVLETDTFRRVAIPCR